MNVYVSRLGHTDGGVQKQNSIPPIYGALCDFLMDAMEGISSLKGNYVGSSKLV
jgi:hypothetical protein